jgi:hypothetical protein
LHNQAGGALSVAAASFFEQSEHPHFPYKTCEFKASTILNWPVPAMITVLA